MGRYIDAETGRRSDTAHCYVYNQARNENLRIVDRTHVNRVLFENDNRAAGIEYQVGGRDGAMQTAHASRPVVISAPSFCSPSILERSAASN
jgi:alcohol oxidase